MIIPGVRKMQKATFIKICHEEGVLDQVAEHMWSLASSVPENNLTTDSNSIKWVKKIARETVELWKD